MEVDRSQVYFVLSAMMVFDEFDIVDLERFTRKHFIPPGVIMSILEDQATPYVTRIEDTNRYRLEESKKEDLRKELKRMWESFRLEYRYKIGPNFLVALHDLVGKYESRDKQESLLLARTVMRGASEKIKVHYWYAMALEAMLKLREAQVINSEEQVGVAKKELTGALDQLEKYRGENNDIDELRRFTS